MSKAELLRQKAMSEAGQSPNPQELLEAVEETAMQTPRTPDELAELLEPLMSVMLKLIEDTTRQMEKMGKSGEWIQNQHTEMFKTWDYYLAKLETQVGRVQNAQGEISKSALFGFLNFIRKSCKELSGFHSRSDSEAHCQEHTRFALAIFYFLNTSHILSGLNRNISLGKTVLFTGTPQQCAEYVIFLIHPSI